MIGLIIYLIIAFIVAFSITIFVKYRNIDDEVVLYVVPLAAGILWPLTIGAVITVVFLGTIVTLFHVAADRIVARLKANKK